MKRIIIAPYLLAKKLLKQYRKGDPFCELKIFSKESFLSNYYYQYGDDALLYITNKYGKDYDISNQILNAISKMQIENQENDKFKELIKIKKELIDNNLISKNDYFEQELKNAEIFVYFYSQNDKELNKYLKDKNVTYMKCEGKLPSCCEVFHSNNEELTYVFNKIANLIDSGVKGNKITIYGLDETDELICSRLVKSYKFHLNNAFRKTILSKVYVNRFIANVLDVGVDEAFEFEKNNSSFDETFEEFTKIVKKYRNESLNNVYQAEIYKSMFNKIKIDSTKYEDGIEVINEPICPEDGYLFIVNMVQGKFPILKKDNGYLSDKEKIKLGIVTSEEENSANYDLYLNYIKQGGNIYLSYSKYSFASKYYPSPLINSLNVKENNDHEINVYYSFDEAQFSYANELDIERNYRSSSKLLKKFRNSKDINIPYKTYTYQPIAVNHFTFDKVIKLSYTSTTTYYECAFKYYLNNVLKVDEIEDSFSLALGKLAHNILENITSGKSFEELYEASYEKYKNEFGEDDWVFLRRIKEDLKRVFNFVIEFEMQIKDGSFSREQKLSTYLDDKVLLEGVLDKVILSNDKSKVAVIDYKTGNTKFEEPLTEYGLALQLPTYSLLLKNNEKYSNSQIAGLFLERLLLPSTDVFYSRVSENDLNSHAKLDGLILDEKDIIDYFDTSDKSDGSKYLAGIKFNKDGSLSKNSFNKLRKQEYFDNLSLLAKQLIVEAGHNILANNFEINPKMVNGDDKSCKYCPFRDICYRDELAFKKITIKKNDEEEEESSNGLN